MIRFVDLSQVIENGMVTYQGLPAPVISDYLSREETLRLRDRVPHRQDRDGVEHRDVSG